MNHIYSVVWNTSLNCLVVASELASGKKCRSKKVSRSNASSHLGGSRWTLFFTPFLVSILLPTELAYAKIYPGSNTNCNSPTQQQIGQVAAADTDTFAPPADGSGSGTWSNVAGCNASGNLQDAATVFGTFAQATGEGALAMGFYANAAKWASAFGLSGTATGIASTALGFGARSLGLNSIAIGGAGGNGTTVLSPADSTTASGTNAIAIGSNEVKGAQATGTNTIAIGGQSSATGSDDAIAIGRGATASASQSIAIGPTANVTTDGASGIALGAATVNGTNGIAQGQGVISGATGQNVAIGSSGTIANSSTAAGGAVAIGRGQTAIGNGAVAIGDPNVSNGTGAVTLGADNTAAGDAAGNSEAAGAVAIGNANSAIGQGSLALGNSSTTTAAGGVALGDTAAVNGANGIAIGTNSRATSATGVGQGGISIGASAGQTSSTLGSVLIGNNANGSGSQGVALGAQTVVNGAQGSAIGYQSSASGNSGTAVGTASSAGGTSSLALGANANASVNNAVAVGSNTSVTLANSVALGSGSSATAVSATTNNTTANALVSGRTFTITQAPTNGVVAIGGRQVQRVADGALTATSTDAVNGSQLFQVVTGLNANTSALGIATTTALGGGAAYNSTTGAWTPPSYVLSSGTTSNVGTALTNMDVLGTKYFKANSFGSDSSATGTDSVAIGPAAVASQTNAVAIGPSSTASGIQSFAAGSGAQAAADGGVALGSLSSVQVVGGIALGQGALSDRAIVQTSGTIPAGNGTIIYDTSDATLLGAVSVGTSSQYRQITNVADATEDHDAVTLRQLTGAMGSLSATGTLYFHANSTNPQDSLAAGLEAIAVGPATVVNGDNGIGIGNQSTVSQAATGGIAIGRDTQVLLASGIAMGSQAQAQGEQAIALGAGAVASESMSVALGSSSTTAAAIGTVSSIIDGNTYNYAGTAPTSTVSVGSLGAERTITNVAAGRVDANSTDAINGSQLNATNSALAAASTVANAGWNITAQGANSSNVAVNSVTGNSIDLKNSDGNILVSKAANSNDITFDLTPDLTANSLTLGGTTLNTNGLTISGGPSVTTAGIDAAGNKITNVATGDLSAGSTEAVNGSQLFTTNAAVANLGTSTATNLGGGSVYDPVTGTVSAPSFTVQGNTYNNVGGAISAVDSNLTTLNSGVTSGSVGVIQRTGNTDETVLTAVGGTGAAPGAAQKLSNLAAGTLSASSTDAVNGSQLYATDQQVAQNTTNITNLGGRVTTMESTVTGIVSGSGVKYFHTNSTKVDSVASGIDSVAVGPNAQASGSNAVATGNDALASGNGAIALGNGARSSAAGSVALGEGATDNGRGAESYTGKYSNATNLSAGTVSVGNSATGQTRTISNVADGREATDAVNVRQLDGAVAESKQYTDQAMSNVNGAVANVTTAISNVDSRVTQVQNTVSAVQNGTDGMFQVSSASAPTKPKATGSGAVAGGAGAVASGNNSTAIGTQAKATAQNSVALGANSVADRDNSVSVGTVGSERQITNIAAATQGTDAVNFDQLNKSVAESTNKANAYTDQRYSQLRKDLKEQDDTLSAGIAGAMAMASLPQPSSAGASMTSIAAANYRGQSALSFGVSRVSDNGRWITKLQATTNTQGDAGVGVGVGYQW
jgi:autotransporter adhesin